MGDCYEYFIDSEAVFYSSDDPCLSRDTYFVKKHLTLTTEAARFIDGLSAITDIDSADFTLLFDTAYNYKERYPWAAVFFKEKFELAGHIGSISIKYDDLLSPFLSLFSTGIITKEQRTIVSKVSILVINSKYALEKAARESELFKNVWDVLCDKADYTHWICMADTPSSEWLEKQYAVDDELLKEHQEKVEIRRDEFRKLLGLGDLLDLSDDPEDYDPFDLGFEGSWTAEFHNDDPETIAEIHEKLNKINKPPIH